MRYHIRLKLYGRNECRRCTIPTTLKDSLTYAETTIRTNDDGWIISPGHRNATQKIYFLGDSWIENSYVPEGLRCVDVINMILDSYKTNYEALNGGMSGQHILHSYNILVNLICKRMSSIVCLFPGRITEYCSQIKNTFWNNGFYSPFTDHETFKDATIYKYDFCDLSNLLQLFNRTVQIFNHRLIIFTVPYRNNNPSIEKQNSFIRSFCAKEGIHCCDLDAIQCDRSSYFYDHIHCNSNGCMFYGSYIGAYLIQNYIGFK